VLESRRARVMPGHVIHMMWITIERGSDVIVRASKDLTDSELDIIIRRLQTARVKRKKSQAMNK
jgi:hypothetical protein